MMEQPKQTQETSQGRHYAARVRIARLATLMSELYNPDFRAIQSPEFQHTHSEYLQAQTDFGYLDAFDEPDEHSHFTTG